jgi:hypothetical protein
VDVREVKKRRARLATLEKEIARWEARQAESEASLEAAAGEAFQRERWERLQGDFQGARARLADLYREWEGLAADLEGV